MKKIYILLISLLMCLTACSAGNSGVVEDKDLPDSGNIVQARTIQANKTILESLKADEAKKFVRDGVNADMNNDELYYCVGQQVPDYTLTDINGNQFKLNEMKGEWIFEVVASWCEHCQNQSKNYTHKLLEAYPDLKIIQYFDQGTEEEIKQFYETTGADINEVTVVAYDPNMYTWIGELWISQYPTFYICKDNEIKWVHAGVLDDKHYGELHKYAFENEIDLKSLRTSEGYPLRTVIDIQQDLGYDKLLQILNFDTDAKASLAYTLKNVGHSLDFNLKRKEDVVRDSEGNNVDLSKFKDSNVVFYALQIQGEDELDLATNNDIVLLNSFVENCPEDVKVVLLITDEDGGKAIEEYDVKPQCEYLSLYNKNSLEDFNKIEFYKGAQLIYVQNGIITGVYANATDLSKMIQGVDLFLSENPVTSIKNGAE